MIVRGDNDGTDDTTEERVTHVTNIVECLF